MSAVTDSDSTLSKIPSEQLRPGMFLHKLCGSWMQHPFWRSSFLIRDADQIAMIIDSGILEVWIDLSRGDGPPADSSAEASHASATDTGTTTAVAVDRDNDSGAEPGRRSATADALKPASTPLDDEIVTARKICAGTKPIIASLFQQARLGKAVNCEAALAVVDEIADSVMRNPSALVSVARLKIADDYTYLHSVAVCALMVALARQLGLDDEDRRQAGLGGLLHDMGKARIPIELLNKPGSLSDKEFAVIRTHPEHGHRLLLDNGITDEGVLDIVLHHHERSDGSGYPHGLRGEQTSQLAKMGAICDVYDAITSDRPYKRGWDPAQSIHRMHGWKGHFDPPTLQHFVKSIGIYPLGALVRLESDKLGVICEAGTESLLKPKVKAFYSARTRQQIAVHEIDLAAHGCQDRIVGVESPAVWGFKNLEQLWMP